MTSAGTLAVNVLPELQCLQLGRRCRAGSPHRGLRVVPREAQGWGRWPPGGGSWSMPRSSPAWPTSLSALGTLQHRVRWAPEGRADLAPAPAPRIRVQVLVPRHRTGVGMKALNGFAVSSGCSALHPDPSMALLSPLFSAASRSHGSPDLLSHALSSRVLFVFSCQQTPPLQRICL